MEWQWHKDKLCPDWFAVDLVTRALSYGIPLSCLPPFDTVNHQELSITTSSVCESSVPTSPTSSIPADEASDCEKPATLPQG